MGNETKTQPDSATEQNATLTRDEISKMVTDTVNAALSTHTTRLKGALMKDVTETLTGALKPIAEQITTLSSAREADTETTTTDPKRQAAMKAAELAAAKQAKEIEALRAQVAASEKAREAEKATRRMQEERASLQAQLTAAGCTGPHLKAAMALLYDGDKRISRTDKDEVGIKSMTPIGEHVIPLEEGIVEWFKSDEGKAFLPARQVQGSGTLSGNASGKPGAQMSKEEADAQIGMAAMQFLHQ